MFIFRMGRRLLNLAYLITCEEIDDAGKVRVTMETGVQFDDDGPDALRLIRQLDELAAHPYPAPVTTVTSRDEPGGASEPPGLSVRKPGA